MAATSAELDRRRGDNRRHCRIRTHVARRKRPRAGLHFARAASRYAVSRSFFRSSTLPLRLAVTVTSQSPAMVTIAMPLYFPPPVLLSCLRCASPDVWSSDRRASPGQRDVGIGDRLPLASLTVTSNRFCPSPSGWAGRERQRRNAGLRGDGHREREHDSEDGDTTHVFMISRLRTAEWDREDREYRSNPSAPYESTNLEIDFSKP